jgi:flagellar assembly protein FliH
LAKVISHNILENHAINKYNFKDLASENTDKKESEKAKAKADEGAVAFSDIDKSDDDIEVDSSSISQSSKDALIESLMKKTDDMSSNFIKLQMKLESMEEEHKKEIITTKDESFKEGLISAKEKYLKEQESGISSARDQFAISLKTLESSATEFKSALEGIKKNLITAAVDIAKEVVNIELNENSQDIASLLSSELIKELQSASKITLKVNPKDHGEISQRVGSLEHVEVISDSAVSEGGVIALSDAGNIDAQISKRFERVKRAALS